MFSCIPTRKEGASHRPAIGLAFSISQRRKFLGADDKKNIPDAGKVDNPPEPGKVEPAKATFPVQDQPSLAKARRCRPPKADKAAPDKAKPQPQDKMSQSKPPAGKGAPATAEAPAATEHLPGAAP